MPVCLEAEYESVINTLGAYAIYSARIRKRILFNVRTLYREATARPEVPEHQPEVPEHPPVLPEQREAMNLLPLHLIPTWPGPTPAMTKLIQQNATEEERSSPFFNVLMSDYPIETLAIQIEATHPDVNFAQIAKLHELRAKRPWWANPRVMIAGVLSVGLFLLNSIPDSVVKTLGIGPTNIDPVEAFDLIVFLITFGVVVLIIAIWLQFKMELAQGQSKMMKNISAALGYLAIRQAGSIARPGATADRPKNTPSSCKEA